MTSIKEEWEDMSEKQYVYILKTRSLGRLYPHSAHLTRASAERTARDMVELMQATDTDIDVVPLLQRDPQPEPTKDKP